jgi:hypothetical protein
MYFMFGAIAALALVSNLVLAASADEPDQYSGRGTEMLPTAAAGDDAVPEGKILELSLLDAQREGLVSVHAEGRGDGRMTVSVTNRTKRQLRVVLPAGIIAQGATGRFGGMGGMGDGMGGIAEKIRKTGTTPAIMRMMLSHMIVYFYGDPDGWDNRIVLTDMMGGIGAEMRSLPPPALPSALLNAGQTRHLPTRLVALTAPDPQEGVKLPKKGEPLQLGDITDISDNPRVQNALRRLASDAAAKSIARLVIWHLNSGMNWESLAQLGDGRANPYEVTLAKDFVTHLDRLPADDTGRLFLEVGGTDAATEALALEVKTALRHRVMLGLLAETGVPARPEGPAVAVHVRISPTGARVIVSCSNASATDWAPRGLFTLPSTESPGKTNVVQFIDAIAEGTLNCLVRVQLREEVKVDGEMHYQLCIDNGSPLVLNGLAAVGVTSGPDTAPRILSGICLSPRKSMNVAARQEVVHSLGLKKRVRIVALDLSGL